jgi:hypothetical protein
LNLARQLIAFTRNHIHVVVCELAPLFLDFARGLFPVAFNLIPVHLSVLCGWLEKWQIKKSLP